MNKEELKELYSFLQNPAFLDLEAEKAMQIAKRFVKNKKKIKKNYKKIRLALLSNFNLSFTIESLEYCLFQRGINAEIFIADFGTMFTELINSNSWIYKFKPDYILIWPTYRDLQELSKGYKAEALFWNSLWKNAKINNIKIFQILFDFPPFSILRNSLNSNLSIMQHIKNTNSELMQHYSNECEFLNIENLIMSLGTKNWHDFRMFHLSKQPYSFEGIPEISQYLASTLAGSLGDAKKVLILDLDNTLWGGEVGDLGKDGIVLGNETSEGEGYISFQSYVKTLNQSGIILAICSKNEKNVVKDVFINHPDMQIKFDDISCFVANFQDKATNIKKIKQFLNVGYDSMVFIDDSEVECQWVKEQLPEVTTIRLKGDPSDYAMQIDRLGLFIKNKITTEDLKRIKSYKALKEIEKVKKSSRKLEDFLSGLHPKIIIEEVYPYALDRVVQLLYKTNQFKLNSIVYSKEEIIQNKSNVLALRFVDRLNDYGIVVVIIFDFVGKKLKIINWVMSCRVFSRNIEYAVYRILKRIAIKSSCNKIFLEFVPSSKNTPAAKAIKKIGFKRVKKSNIFQNNLNCKVKPDNIVIKNTEMFGRYNGKK